MFVAIPYHSETKTSYTDLVKSIKKAGTNPNHTLAVVSLRSHDDEAYLFGNSVTDYFGRHAKVSVDDRPETPTQMSNRFFVAAVQAFGRYVPSKAEAKEAPMLYLDPSYRPNSPRWLDELQSAYFRNGAPMASGIFKQADPPSAIGPIILSRDFLKTTSLLAFMPPDAHWRDYLAWEFAKNGVKAEGIGSHESAVLIPSFEI